MLTCKQVSNALSREDYEKIHPIKRFFLRLHVTICPFCGKFNRQLIESQKMCREFKEREEHLLSDRPLMDDDKKSELKALLDKHISEDPPETKKAS